MPLTSLKSRTTHTYDHTKINMTLLAYSKGTITVVSAEVQNFGNIDF